MTPGFAEGLLCEPLKGVANSWGRSKRHPQFQLVTALFFGFLVPNVHHDASLPTHSHGFMATPMTPFNLFDVAVLMVVLDSKAKKSDENQRPNSEVQNLRADGGYGDEATGKPFGEKTGIQAFVIPAGGNRFKFQALAYGAPRENTKHPVPVELTIEDNSGTTTANTNLD